VVRLPPVIGFLLTGVLIGPSGLGLVPGHEAKLFAEIGVVVLLFTVGLEFSVAHLRPLWRPFLVGGSLQVGTTIAAAAALAVAFGRPLREAVFLGLLAALSSTALVLKALGDRRELQAPQGVLATGIVLFQDLCLAPMIMLAPLLAEGKAAAAQGPDGPGASILQEKERGVAGQDAGSAQARFPSGLRRPRDSSDIRSRVIVSGLESSAEIALAAHSDDALAYDMHESRPARTAPPTVAARDAARKAVRDAALSWDDPAQRAHDDRWIAVSPSRKPGTRGSSAGTGQTSLRLVSG
jgi:hypothetical protein